MTLRLCGPPQLPTVGGAVRSGRYDGYCVPRHGHVGTAYAPVASRRDPSLDAPQKGEVKEAVEYRGYRYIDRIVKRWPNNIIEQMPETAAL